MVKQQIKRGLQQIASIAGPKIWKAGREPRLLILTYHRILPAEHGDRYVEQPGMIVEPKTLRLHLEFLAEYFEFVHLDEWISSSLHNESLPKLACAITFDDGWRDNFDHALPELIEAQVPATVFLVSDLVGTQYSFWPNRIMDLATTWGRIEVPPEFPNRILNWLAEIGLSAAILEGGATQEQVDSAIEVAKRYSDSEIKGVLDRIESVLPQPETKEYDLLGWDEVRAMQKTGLVRFGSHTCTHTRLREGLSNSVLEREVAESSQVITNQLGERPSIFCYPNGNYCQRALDVVRDYYDGGVTTKRGWNRVGDDRFLLSRVGLHNDAVNDKVSLFGRICGIG